MAPKLIEVTLPKAVIPRRRGICKKGTMVVSWVSSAFSETLHTTKHVAHVCLLLIVVALFEVGAGGLWGGTPTTAAYPPLVTLLFQLLRLLPLLALPQAVFNFLGFICFNAFPERAKLKGSPLLAPFLCLRVVTRGDYPDLVRTNVNRNLNTCLRVGLEKFMIEVVTDKKIDLPENQRIRQVVVPSSYRPKSGALFKARALQYCLEEDVNVLADTDWIVHLDEETLATEAAMRGILNFVIEGRHQFGQGLITYANENIQNWFTTLADSFRVSDDMGKLRFQFKVFHKPLFGWKGSYVVTQTGAERRVTFDHGPDGSVAEDNYFGMVALRDGYSFDFIEGEMWEKSPFTIYDFLQQRKRWLQGILLVVHSSHIPVSTKWLLAVSLYSWITMPLALASVVLSTIFPVPVPGFINVIAAFVGAVNFYMYIFGVIKSFRVDRLGWLRMTMCVAGALITMPFNFLVENIAVVRGLVGNKHKFYIVDKVMGAPDKVVSTV
ncbi:beta-1,4-mannosyltransferase egh-like isoform X7 [Eriocheir sinensis]|uniref:beta-1,4-mannosyltransferase egh-like isoform X1 n=2 Tax=Eriocheir sinensis TaxID=95602 RepID=UPI0021CA46FF|nr:beta-1,4-mannosyltransferase egh-like isoform X1 [Eriocheir sinensis]XP_050700602.1 beta-1,4-mannosyltransferase egh-like isoform X2 [Eriocheir sinensis]XP_050700603.1 beta-1,4-mannosyltransferase egh-like isoform X3 [Eriocheir sinensis]XP_050700604.1 beta-1,4-mannosyltransferase egh-like isoform X4 [Eriocheir sinensis]XP_050700605.1 beta-1,4-mannosyltransferase egh-like isoform X5 [Eriocheir sinensis]XP_050700606.1 beta-1,4-mannosyltransferase egh-like isoform X6 [Eriocheir sinensis]XP_05